MSVPIELISPITCEHIVLFKMCELRNGFPYTPCWYDVPVIAQDNFKHYRQFKKKKHNKAILALHFIHGRKEYNSIISPYLCKYHH